MKTKWYQLIGTVPPEMKFRRSEIAKKIYFAEIFAKIARRNETKL
jgi:hypothetical protein